MAVSLVLYPQQWSWNQLRAQLRAGSDEKVAQLAEAALPQAAAEALAFDTWLGQWDHGDHPHNIVFGYDPGQPEDVHSFVFLDFAFSMGLDGRWNQGKFTDVERAPFPALMLDSLAPEALEKTVEAIEALPEVAIRESVERIPDTHISGADRLLIADALCSRQQQLRGPLGSLLP